LRFDGIAVGGALAGRQGVLLAESRLGSVLLSGEEAFHDEVEEAIRGHRSSQSVLVVEEILDLSLTAFTNRSVEMSVKSRSTAVLAASLHARATSA
jgi:hypothetical protein